LSEASPVKVRIAIVRIVPLEREASPVTVSLAIISIVRLERGVAGLPHEPLVDVEPQIAVDARVDRGELRRIEGEQRDG